MKYTVKGTNDYLLDPHKTILNNRDIKNSNFFDNINSSCVLDPYLLDGIETAMDLLFLHLRNRSRILLVVDCDVDGYTSAAILYDYIHRIHPSAHIDEYHHKGKEHGLRTVDVPDDYKLVIVPDAGSSDYACHEELYNRGIGVLVIDHHEAENYSDHAVVINNQLSTGYSNKDLSGVGVVYKFLKALDMKLNVNYADDYLDLVAIGNVADVMNTLSPETLYFVEEGRKFIRNRFIDAIMRKRKYYFQGGVTQTNISWNIAPLINATIRIGSQYDKKLMFRAMSHQVSEDQIEDAVKACERNHRQQSNIKKQAVAALKEQIKQCDLEQDNVLILNASDDFERTLFGLAASNLAEEYCRPVIILQEVTPGYYEGSARGYKHSNFRRVVLDSYLFTFAEGHASAFGVGINKDNVIEAIKYFNTVDGLIIDENEKRVDFEIPARKLSKYFIETCDGFKEYTSKHFPEIKAVVTSVKIDPGSLTLFGKRKNVMSFTHNGIKYIKFNTQPEEYEHLEINAHRAFKVLGTPNMNEYKNDLTPQIVIEELEIQPHDTFDF